MNPVVVGVAAAFPDHYYDQEALTHFLRDAFWSNGRRNLQRLERFHGNMEVKGRHLALPLEAYADLQGFGQSNDVWIRVAEALGEAAICELLDKAQLPAEEISQLTTTTVTGLAVPTLDARLMNRIPFRYNLKRVPLFGLGCLGGAAGLARVADYLRGHPDEAAILLSVELCSLTMQPDDLSIANIISTGLFGDGAAAVLVVGAEHSLATYGRPRLLANRSCFFPDTERVMGWDITDGGFKVVLSADVPQIARSLLGPVVSAFLAENALTLADISFWVAHPGGPKVMQAMEEGLQLPPGALHLSRESLAEVGNVSSASILFILGETISRLRPEPGAYGLMVAMGPAFCAEIVLLRW